MLWNQAGIHGSRADTRDFPGSPVLRTSASNAGDEAEILHAFPQKKKKQKKQKQYHNKFKKDFKNDPHQKKKELTPKEALRIKLPSPGQFIAILGKAFGCPQGTGLFLLTNSFIEI